MARHPEKKALVIAADIARYDLNSREKQRRDGAAALLITANPRLVCLEEKSGYYTEDVMILASKLSIGSISRRKYSTLVYIRAWKLVGSSTSAH